MENIKDKNEIIGLFLSRKYIEHIKKKDAGIRASKDSEEIE